MSSEGWETLNESLSRGPSGRFRFEFCKEVVEGSLLEDENALDSDDQEVGLERRQQKDVGTSRR